MHQFHTLLAFFLLQTFFIFSSTNFYFAYAQCIPEPCVEVSPQQIVWAPKTDFNFTCDACIIDDSQRYQSDIRLIQIMGGTIRRMVHEGEGSMAVEDLGQMCTFKGVAGKRKRFGTEATIGDSDDINWTCQVAYGVETSDTVTNLTRVHHFQDFSTFTTQNSPISLTMNGVDIDSSTIFAPSDQPLNLECYIPRDFMRSRKQTLTSRWLVNTALGQEQKTGRHLSVSGLGESQITVECQINWRDGEILSRKVEILPSYGPFVEIATSKEAATVIDIGLHHRPNLQLPINQEEVSCIARANPPITKMEWLIDGKSVKREVLTTSRKEARLNLKLEFGTSRREVTCSASNRVTNQTTSIIAVDSSTVDELAVMLPSTSSSVHLDCAGDGDVTFLWFLNGAPIPDPLGDEKYKKKSVFETSKEGIYSCHDQDTWTPLKKFRVLLQSKPVIENTNEIVGVSLGKSAKLVCVAVGLPKASIAWYHNGTRLVTDTTLDKFTIEDVEHSDRVQSVLTLSKVSEADLSTYVCRASNAIGNATSQIVAVRHESSWTVELFVSVGVGLLFVVFGVLLVVLIKCCQYQNPHHPHPTSTNPKQRPIHSHKHPIRARLSPNDDTTMCSSAASATHSSNVSAQHTSSPNDRPPGDFSSEPETLSHSSNPSEPLDDGSTSSCCIKNTRSSPAKRPGNTTSILNSFHKYDQPEDDWIPSPVIPYIDPFTKSHTSAQSFYNNADTQVEILPANNDVSTSYLPRSVVFKPRYTMEDMANSTPGSAHNHGYHTSASSTPLPSFEQQPPPQFQPLLSSIPTRRKGSQTPSVPPPLATDV